MRFTKLHFSHANIESHTLEQMNITVIICLYYLLIIIILLRAVLYSWVIMLRRVSISNDPGYKQTTSTIADQTWSKSRYGKIELDPIWTDERQRQTYGNGERYFYVSYEVLPELLRMNVILIAKATATATVTATDMECWKSGMRPYSI